MEKKKVLAFALSYEEILILMRKLDFKQLLGIDSQTFEQADENYKALVISVAQRSLLAHSILLPDLAKQDLKVTDTVHGVLRACAIPDLTVAIERNAPGRATQTFYLHRARKVNVLHMETIPLIHQFLAFPSPLELTQAAVAALEVKNIPAAECKGGTLPRSVITKAFKVNGEDQPEKVKAILKKYLDETTSQLFAEAICKPQVNASLTQFKTRESEPPQYGGLAFLAGESTLWSLIPDNINDEKYSNVIVHAISTTDLFSEVKKLIV